VFLKRGEPIFIFKNIFLLNFAALLALAQNKKNFLENEPPRLLRWA
jgi:hypothetical protein